MPRLILRSLALAAVLAILAGASAAADLAPQSSSQQGVTVKVTPASLAGAQWEFSIVFDTHSGALNDDPMKTAALVVDGGAPAAPVAWQGDAPGGHHRTGVLRFKPSAPSPASFELRLQRPGEAGPRTFRWRLR